MNVYLENDMRLRIQQPNQNLKIILPILLPPHNYIFLNALYLTTAL